MVKLQLLILGACFIHASVGQTRSIDPEVQKEIDDFIYGCYFDKSGISKLGLTIVQDDGEILYTTGFGYADHEKDILNTNQTQFLIGSVTKSFTSLVVIKVLHEKFPKLGEAVLDTPIRKLIPSVNFTLIDRFRSEHATFRDLLSHRMCLFRDDWQMMAEPFNTTTEIVYRQRYADPICGMRTQSAYNNQMYVLTGELIGILANSSYKQLINDLLADLGMLNSSLVSKSDDFSNMPYRAQPYYVMNNLEYPLNTDLIKRLEMSSPAGGLFVPPNDMVRYLRLHLNKGNVDGKQIIPENVMAWMTKPSTYRTSAAFKSSDNDRIMSLFGYGLGLNLASYDGWQHIHHGGYFSPYDSLMSLFPGKNLGIFTSSNEGPGKVEPIILHSFIFDVLRGNANATEQCQFLAKEKANKVEKEIKKAKTLQNFLEDAKTTPRMHQENEIVGEYGNGAQGDAQILEKFNEKKNETGLYFIHGNWAQGWLDYLGDSLYQITWDTDLVQDNFARGDTEGYGYAKVENETLQILLLADTETGLLAPMGTFKLGESLATLPAIPWSPGSCGPETK